MALGKDLAEIREELGVDINVIQGRTKLSLEIILKIESDAIFNSDIYNDAYKRNFVRSYARALKIKEATIVRALNAMDKGTYDHSMVKDVGASNPTDSFAKEEEKHHLEADSTPKKALIRTELNYDAKTKIEATKKTLINSEAKEVIDLPTTSNKATEPSNSTDSKKINPSDNPQASESTTEKSQVSASVSNQEKPSPTGKAESDMDSSDYSESLSNNPKKTPNQSSA